MNAYIPAAPGWVIAKEGEPDVPIIGWRIEPNGWATPIVVPATHRRGFVLGKEDYTGFKAVRREDGD